MSTPDMWLARSARLPATETFLAWPGILVSERSAGAEGFEMSRMPRPEWPLAT